MTPQAGRDRTLSLVSGFNSRIYLYLYPPAPLSHASSGAVKGAPRRGGRACMAPLQEAWAIQSKLGGWRKMEGKGLQVRVPHPSYGTP